jgi:AraC family transcriptional regulator
MRQEKSLAVDLSQETSSLQIFPRSPLLSSHNAGWDGIHLEYHNQPSYQTPESFATQHILAIQTEVWSPRRIEGKLDRHFQSEQFKEGDFLLVPANISHFVRWHQEHRFILLSLEPKYFARAICDCIDPELIPYFLKSDPLIHQIGLVLKTELETGGAGGQLYVEAMTHALFIHLLRHYSSQQNIIRNYSGGLSKFKLKQVIDYINNHLERDLSLTELATMVQMSSSYFCRSFKQSTGEPPHQYVIQRRLERAKQLLLQDELTLAEIAYRVGFANQGHLNRHFKRRFGITPRQMKQKL